MLFRIVFMFVSATAVIFAQAEGPAPSGTAAKVTLPPAPSTVPSDVGSARSAQPDTPAPAGESSATAPKPVPESPAAASPRPTVAQTTSPKPEKNTSPAHKPYVFGALDVVRILIYNQPSLSGVFPISSDGFISIPVVGDIKADGLTAKQLRDTLTQRLKECCINNPEGEVDVQLGANHSKRFFVYGAVGKPGEYPLDRDDLTIMDVMSDIGGFREFAKKKKIRLMRGRKEYVFNYVEVSRGRHMEQNIVVENGDRIFVDGE